MAKYKRKNSVSEPNYRVKIAYNEITNRLNGLGIRWDGSLDLDDAGFGHAWIKVYRFDKKAEYIYICSHNDNMDPECCEPIYRFIKVYNYTDDTMDDYVPGDIPFYAGTDLNVTSSSVEEILAKLKSDYKAWADNEYVYAAKYGVLWMFMKDPIKDDYCIPFTNYPLNVKSLDTEKQFDAGQDWRFWPFCTVDDNYVYYERTVDDEKTIISSAISGICSDDTAMYVGLSYKELEDIYIPYNSNGGVYTISGNINTYYDDPTNIDDFRICPKCLGTNKIVENDNIISCPREGTLDIDGTHYVSYSNKTSVPSYDVANMFTVGKVNGSKVDLKRRTVSGYKLSSDSHFATYLKEYPFWFRKLNNEGKFELHYNLYSSPMDKANDGLDEAALLYSGVATVVLSKQPVDDDDKPKTDAVKDTHTVTLSIGASTVEITFQLPWYEEVGAVSLADTTKYNIIADTELVNADYSLNSPTRTGQVLPFGVLTNKHVPYETKADRADIIHKYVEIQPYLIYSRRGWQYPPFEDGSQILNYTTHNKSKTFDYPWNYDEIMNFINYKDENLKIYASDKGLTYSNSHTYQTDNSQFKNLKNIKVWYGDIDNDDLDVSEYVLNFSRDCDFPLADNMDDYKAHTNIYNYNPGYQASVYTSNGSKRYGLRSLPTYEGIFQYKKGEYEDIPDSYAWIKTESGYNASNNKQFMYYTGDVDTYELHNNYINQFFQFRTTKPVHSVYYKEEFSAFDELSAGSACFMAIPASDTSPATFSIKNDFTNPQAATYGGDRNLPYVLPGLKDEHLRYRHICSACSGMGNLGITIQTANPPEHTHKRSTRYNKGADHPYRCPCCRGSGVRMRYVYLDHQLITSGHNPVSMTDADKEKEILYETLDKKPIEYWYNATGVDDYSAWKKQERWEDYVYESVELSGFKTDSAGRQVPSVGGSIDTTKCYRWYNDIDDCVSYSAFDHAFGWQRIYFDKAWIKGKWNETKDWEEVNQMLSESWSVDDAEHLHHSHENIVTFKTCKNEQVDYEDSDFHNYNLRTYKVLNTVCPQCEGKKTVINYLYKPDGSPNLDVMGEQRTEEVTCPLCYGEGKIEKTHYEGYNIQECTHCNQTGTIVCPKCKGTKKVGDKDCDNCCYDAVNHKPSQTPTGSIVCPSCGGMLVSQSKFCMISPDRESGKKVYKYNMRKCISSDNIMVEMDRIKYNRPEYAPGRNDEIPNPTVPPTDYEKQVGITKENTDFITMENGSIILREYYVAPTGYLLVTEDLEQLLTEDGFELATEDWVEPEPEPEPSISEDLTDETGDNLSTEDGENLVTEGETSNNSDNTPDTPDGADVTDIDNIVDNNGNTILADDGSTIIYDEN